MRIHRHVLSVFLSFGLRSKRSETTGHFLSPQHCRIQFLSETLFQKSKISFGWFLSKKNFRTSSILIFHVLPPLAVLFRFPRPKTARFPSISHGPSNSPSCGSAGGFRLLTVPCTEKCSSKKFGKCYTIIIYPSGPKTIKKNVFLEKTIIWVWICS